MDSKIIIDIEKQLERVLDDLNPAEEVESILLEKVQGFKRELHDFRTEFNMEFIGDVAQRFLDEIPNSDQIKVSFEFKTKLVLKIYNDWIRWGSPSQKNFISKIREITDLKIQVINTGFCKTDWNEETNMDVYGSYVTLSVRMTKNQLNKEKEFFKEEVQKIIMALVHFKEEK